MEMWQKIFAMLLIIIKHINTIISLIQVFLNYRA